MATEKLQIQLDADWRGKSEVKQANNDIDKLDDGVGKTTASFSKFAKGAAIAGAAIVAVGAAAKLAWDTIGEGAALLQARDQFDRLTVSIGSTSDAMLTKLKDATNGLVSDSELIASAGQIISLGLGKTEEDVVRLANLVSQLGWDMQQVILTFANNSKARLDSLGLSIEDVNANIEVLVAQGYNLDAAFDLAVIQAGEQKLELLGSTAETSAGKLQQIITVGENAKTSFQESFAITLADQLDDASIAAGSTAEALNALASSAGVSFASIVAQAENAVVAILRIQLAVATVQLALSRVINTNVPGAAAKVTANELELRNLEIRLADLQGTSIPSTTAHFDPVAQLGMARAGVGVTKEATVATAELTEVQGEFNAMLAGEALDSTRDYAAGMLDFADKTEFGADVTDDLIHGIGGVGIAADTAAEEMARLAAETGNFFDQARRSDDFDPAEIFYQSALAAGASAQQLQQLLVGTGLETPERAQEIRDESIQRQLAAQAGEALAGGGNFDMLWQGIQAGIANPQLAAQQVGNVTHVGGVSVSVTIYGDITGEDLDMTVDNAVSEAKDQFGDTAGGTG